MGKVIETPKYRHLRKGEVIKDGDLCQLISDPNDPWEESGAVGLKVGHGIYTEACRYKRLVPKPTPKAKWAPIPLDTKQAKPKIIEIANKFGAENAKLKNQITKLKGAKA